MNKSDGRGRDRGRSVLPHRLGPAAMGRNPCRDVLAASTVTVAALPLALGFGISSGLGAQAGLVTAVVAGLLAALCGGSNLQVSGPTGAMTVVLVPIMHAHGASGVLTVGLRRRPPLPAGVVPGRGGVRSDLQRVPGHHHQRWRASQHNNHPVRPHLTLQPQSALSPTGP